MVNLDLPISHPIRIAYLGIRHASNTLAITPTTDDHFVVIRDAEGLRSQIGQEHIPADVDIRADYLANATPGGEVKHSGHARLEAKCLQMLRQALPVGGVLLDLHGAMEVEGMGA